MNAFGGMVDEVTAFARSNRLKPTQMADIAHSCGRMKIAPIAMLHAFVDAAMAAPPGGIEFASAAKLLSALATLNVARAGSNVGAQALFQDVQRCYADCRFGGDKYQARTMLWAFATADAPMEETWFRKLWAASFADKPHEQADRLMIRVHAIVSARTPQYVRDLHPPQRPVATEAGYPSDLQTNVYEYFVQCEDRIRNHREMSEAVPLCNTTSLAKHRHEVQLDTSGFVVDDYGAWSLDIASPALRTAIEVQGPSHYVIVILPDMAPRAVPRWDSSLAL